MSDNEIKLRDILKPHFGNLPLYMKLMDNDADLGISQIVELNIFLKKNKNSITYMGTDIHNYRDYYKLLYDIKRFHDEYNVIKHFNNVLNSSGKVLLKKCIEIDKDIADTRKPLNDLMEILSKGHLYIFKRTCSRVKTVETMLSYIKKVLDVNSDAMEVVKTIKERGYDMLKHKSSYIVKMDETLLDLCPPAWCMKNSASDYHKHIKDFNLDSIWFYVNPIESDSSRRYIGIDLATNGDITYMDSNNDSFSKSLPITKDVFMTLISKVHDFKKDNSKKKKSSTNIEQAIGRLNRWGVDYVQYRYYDDYYDGGNWNNRIDDIEGFY